MTVVGALVTTKVPEPVLGNSVGTVVVSPPNDPLKRVGPPGLRRRDGTRRHPGGVGGPRARLRPVQLQRHGLSGHRCVGVVVDQRARHRGRAAVGPGGRTSPSGSWTPRWGRPARCSSRRPAGSCSFPGRWRSPGSGPPAGSPQRWCSWRRLSRPSWRGTSGPSVPDPSVKVTGWLASGVLPVVRTPDSTTGCPLVVELCPGVGQCGDGRRHDEGGRVGAGRQRDGLRRVPRERPADRVAPGGLSGRDGARGKPGGVRRAGAGLGAVDREGHRLVRDGLIEVGIGQAFPTPWSSRRTVTVAGFTVSIVGSVTERLLVAVANVS